MRVFVGAIDPGVRLFAHSMDFGTEIVDFLCQRIGCSIHGFTKCTRHCPGKRVSIFVTDFAGRVSSTDCPAFELPVCFSVFFFSIG